ncbi:MAG: succinylglutamate desuccinylase/aspartoacylase family protein [Microthrixaceae bacterium]
MARLPTRSWMSLPVVVMCGSRPGPTVWLSAAVHGDELLGVEIIRQVIRGIDPRRLSGTILAVPVVNVPGFLAQSRYTPDRRDLNRSFPGSPRGSLASRLAHLFMGEIVARCDAGLDLHTGSNHRENLPQIRCNTDDEATLAMAQAFAPPAILHAKLRPGSLRSACANRGIPVLLLEAGEALRYAEVPLEVGVLGVRRTLAHLGMLRDGPESPLRPAPVIRSSTWVRARRSGLVRFDVDLGDQVTAGERIGTVADAHGHTRSMVKSRVDGLVVGITRNPLVNQGDALVHLGEFADSGRGIAQDPSS